MGLQVEHPQDEGRGTCDAYCQGYRRQASHVPADSLRQRQSNRRRGSFCTGERNAALHRSPAMSEETRPILCGRCHVGVEKRTDPNGQEMAFCPNCGESDTIENAIGEAADYLTNKTLGDMLDPFE